DRLRAIYSAVADEPALRDLVLAQWDTAIAADTSGSDAKAFWGGSRRDAADYLAKIQVRDRLLLDNLGLLWPRLLETMTVDSKNPQRRREGRAMPANLPMTAYANDRRAVKSATKSQQRFPPRFPSHPPPPLELWKTSIVGGIAATFSLAAVNAMPGESADHG